jgi:hypothetical protein
MKMSVKLIKIGFALIIYFLFKSCAKDIITKKLARAYKPNYIFKKDLSEVQRQKHGTLTIPQKTRVIQRIMLLILKSG